MIKSKEIRRDNMKIKNKEEAIEYLKGKAELESKKYNPPEPVPTEKELIKSDEEKIERVIKKGKLYGDPLVEIEV